MKYKCLIFDHDDTTVNSTATIHYPCFVEFLQKYHPEQSYTLDEYVLYNFDPGVFDFYHNICGFSHEETEFEHQYWLEYASHHWAEVFPGIREIMEEHKAAGGILAVVSHSHAENILRDYKMNGLPLPDAIFGFEQPRNELKPSPIPVQKIMERFGLKPSEILVIDDLKPGLVMARAAGVDFAAASWCFDIPENSAFMKANADYFCRTVEELKEMLMQRNGIETKF